MLTIEGLPHVKNGELLSVGQDKYALVMNLEEGKVGAILLTDSYELGEGDIVYSTGKIVGVPVGDALLGRVVNPLGLPLDGGKPIVTSKTRSVEAPAPAIFDRANVNEPLQTGIKAIDSHRRRYHHQSEGKRRYLRLCRHRTKDFFRQQRFADAEKPRRARLYRRRLFDRERIGSPSIYCTLYGNRDCGRIYAQRKGCFNRL